MSKFFPLFLCSVAALIFLPPPASGSSHHRSSSHYTAHSSSSKPVHVRSFRRKNGTVVHSYDRALPGTKTQRSRTHIYSYRYSTRHRYSTIHSTEYSSTHRTVRSEAAKRLFELEHPCPGTGLRTGKCQGYIIDHVIPLACGGTDATSNMQWQTVAEAKAKDKVERIGCKR